MDGDDTVVVYDCGHDTPVRHCGGCDPGAGFRVVDGQIEVDPDCPDNDAFIIRDVQEDP